MLSTFADGQPCQKAVWSADDSSMLVLLLETHQQLWSQLQALAGAGDPEHMTLSGFLQQAGDLCKT